MESSCPVFGFWTEPNKGGKEEECCNLILGTCFKLISCSDMVCILLAIYISLSICNQNFDTQ